ncbi:Retrovirus-related Pol polyprotein from transposon 17.6 [Araneus ventricosus]|uniref:RNA-directed DNA polymerase n=1 Tax=Araneus ventricosus TaxID=182803 RepID=A0A4Y2NWZ8_ARAVE|nr:Retrovirus-related Pol polyprotein from transposon 17.6 [Araneus ventricosus]
MSEKEGKSGKADDDSESLNLPQYGNSFSCSRVAVWVPAFWANNVKLYFAQIEGNFRIAGIVSEQTKFVTLVAALDPQTLSHISDLLYTPPKHNPYTALKNRLLSEFEVSQNKKVRALLEDLDLGDRKPSLLLRQMQELSEGLVDDAFLKILWLNRLPVNIRTILSISSESLSKLAEMAYPNGSHIKTFGSKLLSFDLGLERKLQWPFVIADITKPIIGADFLQQFGLLVDLKKRCLLDPITNLKCMAQTFQRFINEVLYGFDFCFAYIDDILVFSKDKTEHTQHLEQIFKRFVELGIIINESKCEFGKPQVDFLGHTINSEGILPMCTKVKAIQEFPKPETVNQLRSFLGMVNFYHRFIPKIAEILSPLNAYLVGWEKKDKTKIKWNPETDASFDKIKMSLADATLLSHPLTDAKLALATYCSDFDMGGA